MYLLVGLKRADFKEISCQQIRLYGYAVKHLLEEDSEYGLSEKSIEYFKEKNGANSSIYLVQIYDDKYTDTEKIITVVGSEIVVEHQKYELTSITIPQESYLVTKFANDQEDVDVMYRKCYGFF
ncbi:hypothetical protein BTTAP_140013 [Brochothrix thermosphacta]|uniref:hypothetical protein n=1 Tax=Brochothrix thermosphacta TaxID=2756 RepID=UPI000D7B0F32|nr:hypothetical protein [Brochothrix thermosphacta]SPP27297.1 hypothetical protein BTTAP_140013 [Brochothrix thermosphacta]